MYADLLRGVRRPADLTRGEIASIQRPYALLERIDAAHGPRVPEDCKTLAAALRAAARQRFKNGGTVTIRVGSGTHQVTTPLRLSDGVRLVGSCPAGAAVVEVIGCIGIRTAALGAALVNLRIFSAVALAADDGDSDDGGGDDDSGGESGDDEDDGGVPEAGHPGDAPLGEGALDQDGEEVGLGHGDDGHIAEGEELFDGIQICGGDLLIQDCDISFAGGAGVVVRRAEGSEQGEHWHPFDSERPPRLLRCSIHDGGDTGVFIADSCCELIECAIAAHQLSNLEMKNCSPGTLLRHCTIEHGEEAGLHIYDGGAPIIESCAIRGNCMAGVAVRDGSNPVLRRCVIEGGWEGGVMAMGLGKHQFNIC